MKSTEKRGLGDFQRGDSRQKACASVRVCVVAFRVRRVSHRRSAGSG